MNFSIIFFRILSLTLLSLPALAQVNPDIDWKQVETEHFTVVFDAKQQELGHSYAAAAEEAYRLLEPIFTYKPEKTVIIINDSTDLTNGYATRVPYPHIMVYPVLPGPQESIAEFGNWPRELITHEFTHVLSFEPATGVVHYLRKGFGSIMSPNLLLPRWFLEGIAVDEETRWSAKGRLRSAYQDAALRTMVDTGTLWNYDISELPETSIPSWPMGARPYLFGSIIWSEMIAMSDTNVIHDLHDDYGGSFPFLIESQVRSRFHGMEYADIFSHARQSVSERARAQAKQLETQPLSKLLSVELDGRQNQSPVISPDGLKMLFITESEIGDRTIQILKRDSTKDAFDGKHLLSTVKSDSNETLTPSGPHQMQDDDDNHDGPPGGAIARADWFPDSKRFVFDKVHEINRYQFFSELFIYDLETKKSKPLSHDIRAREPAVSPSGNQITFVQLDGGQTHLGLIQADGSQIQVLFSAKLQELISFPFFLTEQEIVFSLRTQDGTEHLKKMNLSTHEIQDVLPQFQQARFSHKNSDGFIFAANQNGTYNVYLASQDLNSAHPLTHVNSTVFYSDLDMQTGDLYVTHMTNKGLQIARIEKALEQNLPAELPKISPLFQDRYKAPAEPAHYDQSQLKDEDYSPWGFLLPHYWLPSVFQTDNGFMIEAITGSQDPVAHHVYSLQAGWDTYLKKDNLAFQYTNTVTPIAATFTTYDRYSSLVDNSRIARDTDTSLLLSKDLNFLSPYADAGLGWSFKKRNLQGVEVNREGPAAVLAYSNMKMSSAQISPESGGAATLTYQKYLKDRSDYEYEQYSFQGVKYFSQYLPKRHAIMLRAQGTYTPQDIPFAFALSNAGYAYAANLLTGDLLVRGYSSGQFVGKSMATTNFEYRFPVDSIYRGWGTMPLFLKRSHIAFFTDSATVDGYVYNSKTQAYEKSPDRKMYYSVGGEFKLDTTVAYNFPITFVLGYYQALTEPARDNNNTLFLGVQM